MTAGTHAPIHRAIERTHRGAAFGVTYAELVARVAGRVGPNGRNLCLWCEREIGARRRVWCGERCASAYWDSATWRPARASRQTRPWNLSRLSRRLPRATARVRHARGEQTRGVCPALRDPQTSRTKDVVGCRSRRADRRGRSQRTLDSSDALHPLSQRRDEIALVSTRLGASKDRPGVARFARASESAARRFGRTRFASSARLRFAFCVPRSFDRDVATSDCVEQLFAALVPRARFRAHALRNPRSERCRCASWDVSDHRVGIECRRCLRIVRPWGMWFVHVRLRTPQVAFVLAERHVWVT